jgi:hypothetical protein
MRRFEEEVKRLKEEFGMIERKSAIRNEEKDAELKDVLKKSDTRRLFSEGERL